MYVGEGLTILHPWLKIYRQEKEGESVFHRGSPSGKILSLSSQSYTHEHMDNSIGLTNPHICMYTHVYMHENIHTLEK